MIRVCQDSERVRCVIESTELNLRENEVESFSTSGGGSSSTSKSVGKRNRREEKA